MQNILIILFALFQFALAGRPSDPSQDSPPAVNISPGSLDFRDQVVKRPSKPLRITVTNTGGTDLYINSVVIGGDNHQDFVLRYDSCTGATVKSKKSCVVDVIFTPSVNERRRAQLIFTDNAVDSPQKVPLEGNGINSVAEPPRKPGVRR